MNRVKHYVGPTLPPTLEAYDYLRTLSRGDWAWEGLRRNPVYQDTARPHLLDRRDITQFESGAIVTRLREPSPDAEAWGLRSFRGCLSDST
jgi:hypothetical protein